MVKISFSYPLGVRSWPPEPSCAPIVDEVGLIVTALSHFIGSLRQAARRPFMSYTIHTTISWAQTMRELRETMAKWGVADWDVYKPSERGGTVMLKYVKNGRSVTLPMGSQARADDNLRVLYLAVEAMRMNEKRGLGEVIQEAYLQLAAPEKEIDPWELLGIRPDAAIELAEAAWKVKMKTAHPDAGGSEEQVKKLNAAIEAVRKERG